MHRSLGLIKTQTGRLPQKYIDLGSNPGLGPQYCRAWAREVENRDGAVCGINIKSAHHRDYEAKFHSNLQAIKHYSLAHFYPGRRDRNIVGLNTYAILWLFLHVVNVGEGNTIRILLFFRVAIQRMGERI